MVDKELLNIFLSESYEELDKINKIALELEKKYDKATLEELDRNLHTLKGNSSLMGFKNFSELAHIVEDVVREIKAGKRKVSSNVVNLLLKASDEMRNFLDNVKRGKEKKIDLKGFKKLISNLESFKPVDVTAFQYRTKETIRVASSKLDELLNVSSELKAVISSFKMDIMLKNQLNKVSDELQQMIIDLRLIPLDDVFSNYPRMIRELALNENKKINFVMETNGVKLDRGIVEAINSPMVHLLRNAVDHGIESPDTRIKKGKNPVGRIEVKVVKDKESAVITVSDDGRGIDFRKISEKANEEGIENLKKEELLELIFKPGFSTSDKVTEISGRGIGMNVVRENLRRIGGSIDVETKENKGTSFIMRVPLNISIMNALIIGVGEKKYALLLMNIKSVEKYRKKEHHKNKYNGCRFYNLGHVLGTKKAKMNYVVMLENKSALGVENIYGKREILIKRLDKILTQMKSFSGAAVLEGEEVCLVLDVNGLIENAN